MDSIWRKMSLMQVKGSRTYQVLSLAMMGYLAEQFIAKMFLMRSFQTERPHGKPRGSLFWWAVVDNVCLSTRQNMVWEMEPLSLKCTEPRRRWPGMPYARRISRPRWFPASRRPGYTCRTAPGTNRSTAYAGIFMPSAVAPARRLVARMAKRKAWTLPKYLILPLAHCMPTAGHVRWPVPRR